MKIVFITPRHKDDDFDVFLGPSLKKIPTRCINVADKPGTDNVKTITHKYNVGVGIAKDKDLLDKDTIIVFAKSNIHIVDSLFAEKINMIFEDSPNTGIVGVLGTKEIHNDVSLYSVENKPVNGIIYARENNVEKGDHIQYSKNGFFDDIVAIDDSIIAVRGSLLLENDALLFDCDCDEGYGIEIALKSVMNGYNTVVADILVVSKEKSERDFTIIDKIVKPLGLEYPITVSSLGKTINSVVEIEL
jgi:hypothetical protein